MESNPKVVHAAMAFRPPKALVGSSPEQTDRLKARALACKYPLSRQRFAGLRSEAGHVTHSLRAIQKAFLQHTAATTVRNRHFGVGRRRTPKHYLQLNMD